MGFWNLVLEFGVCILVDLQRPCRCVAVVPSIPFTVGGHYYSSLVSRTVRNIFFQVGNMMRVFILYDRRSLLQLLARPDMLKMGGF